MKNIITALAKFYNSLPSQLKILIMVASSGVAAQLLIVFLGSLSGLIPTIHSQVVVSILQDFMLPLTGLLNLLQEYARTEGTKLLASQGDPKTLNVLQDSISEKQDIINSSVSA